MEQPEANSEPETRQVQASASGGDVLIMAAAPTTAEDSLPAGPSGPWYHHAYNAHGNKQIVDRVVIETEPRWKDSEMSGSQWRYSATVKYYYKDDYVASTWYSDVEAAMDEVKHFYRSELVYKLWEVSPGSGKCDQEGCAAEATKFFRVKKRSCTSCGHEGEEVNPKRKIEYVAFCPAHAERGDCSLNDCDDNLEEIDGEPVKRFEEANLKRWRDQLKRQRENDGED